MNTEEMKASTTAVLADLNQRIAALRAAGVNVNVWLTSIGPASVAPPSFAFDFDGVVPQSPEQE
jgi:hypothetical protein